MDQKSIGFNAEITHKSEENIGEVLKKILPQDLVKFGLIPEFVGRVPMVVSLDQLDETALERILTEPKNAIVKQYEKLFELDDVQLTFEPEALKEVAKKSLERKTGARGLRASMEQSMLDLMYQIPSDESIESCVVTKDVIDGTGEPIITRRESRAGRRRAI